MSKDIEFIKKSVHRMFIKKGIYDLRFFSIFFFGDFFLLSLFNVYFYVSCIKEEEIVDVNYWDIENNKIL